MKDLTTDNEETSLKVCSRCREEKDATEFWNNKNRKDGRYPYCKVCARADILSYYHKTKQDDWQKKSRIKQAIRVCIDCKEHKPTEQFDISITYGWRSSVCVPCKRVRSHKDYIKNRDARMERKSEYKKSPQGKETEKRAHYAAMQREPEKYVARYKLRYAVSRGQITKEPCQDCGKAKVEAHHHKGYEPEHWLDVMWLCRKHHRDIHKFTLESRGLI